MFCSFNFISPYCANTESSLAQLSSAHKIIDIFEDLA